MFGWLRKKDTHVAVPDNLDVPMVAVDVELRLYCCRTQPMPTYGSDVTVRIDDLTKPINVTCPFCHKTQRADKVLSPSILRLDEYRSWSNNDKLELPFDVSVETNNHITGYGIRNVYYKGKRLVPAIPLSSQINDE